jgi:hypothetical protein
MPRKTAKGSAIFFYRSNRVEEVVFPRQYLFSRFALLSP